MAPASVIAVLTFFHIVSAIGWLGGVIFFISAVGPGLKSFTPGASLEYLTKVGPKQIRFFIGAATATIIFGLGLLFTTFGSDYASWPWYIEAGFSFGLVAYLIAMLVAVPAFSKAEHLARERMSSPVSGPPSPEFVKSLKRGNQAVMVVAVILFIALAFMVSSAVFA